MKEDKKVLNVFALLGFILGLLSVILYWFLSIIPLLAIVFSIVGLISCAKLKQKGKKLAVVGLILGILFTCQVGMKIILKNNNYLVNIENEKKDEKINYCEGGNIRTCNQAYTCAEGQVMSCMGGVSMSCTGGNWNLGTTCIHGYTIPHIYTNPCQHGQTISHTYTNPCIHGVTYVHNEPCIHGFTYTHNYTEKCIHGYEKGHSY